MEQFRPNAIPGASNNSDGSQWTANRVCQVMSPSPYLTDIGHGYSSTFNSQEIKQSLQYQHTEMNKDLSKKERISLPEQRQQFIRLTKCSKCGEKRLGKLWISVRVVRQSFDEFYQCSTAN